MSHVPIRWGLTGTVPKEQYEFMSLRCSLGEVIGKLSASELQQEGVLSNCHVNVVQLIDHKEYRSYQEELKYLLSTEERMAYMKVHHVHLPQADLCEKIGKSNLS